MHDVVLQGAPPLHITMRRSARARRITLRVSAIDGRITLTLPKGVSEREAATFAAEKEAWIRRHLEKCVAPSLVGFGSVLPFEGRLLTVQAGTGRTVRATEDTLLVPMGRRPAGVPIAAFLKAQARARLVAASDRYAARLGKPYARISLRDTRSRWGSCSSAGRLMYSWRLILAPPRALDYVAAHEVAHLAEMNHSSAFWETVERIHGPYAAERNWLRDEGSALHRYRFAD